MLTLSVACVAAFATGSLAPSERAAHPRRAAPQGGRSATRRIGVAQQVRVDERRPNAGPRPLPVAAPTPPATVVASTPPPASPAPGPPAITDPQPVAPTPSPPPPAAPEAPTPAPTPEPPTPSPPPPPPGEVVFAAKFEQGFEGWYVQSLPGRATISKSADGPGAARFEVRQGDVEPDTGSQRSEVSGPTFKQGEDLYIRDVIRIPSSNAYTTPWEIIQQLHEEDWSGSPGMAVFLEPAPSLRLGAGDGSPVFWRSAPLQPDRWYDLVYRVYLSEDAADGFVEVWLDGVQQELIDGQTRIYGQTMQMPETYLKAGIYRSKSSTGTSIVEHQTIVVGTSLTAVEGL